MNEQSSKRVGFIPKRRSLVLSPLRTFYDRSLIHRSNGPHEQKGRLAAAQVKTWTIHTSRANWPLEWLPGLGTACRRIQSLCANYNG